jgi:CRP-like cAMP-binding protein
MIVLKETLANRYGLGEENASELIKLFVGVNFPKHSFLVQQRVMSDEIFYISKGLAREFYLFDGVNDEDNTTQFIREGEFYFPTSSFLENKPTEYYTQVLEPVKAFILTKETIDENMESSLLFSKLINHVFKDCLLRQSKRIDLFMKSRRSVERYKTFISENPELSNRLTDKYIASYLAINSSTLSRIRSSLME